MPASRTLTVSCAASVTCSFVVWRTVNVSIPEGGTGWFDYRAQVSPLSQAILGYLPGYTGTGARAVEPYARIKPGDPHKVEYGWKEYNRTGTPLVETFHPKGEMDPPAAYDNEILTLTYAGSGTRTRTRTLQLSQGGLNVVMQAGLGVSDPAATGGFVFEGVSLGLWTQFMPEQLFAPYCEARSYESGGGLYDNAGPPAAFAAPGMDAEVSCPTGNDAPGLEIPPGEVNNSVGIATWGYAKSFGPAPAGSGLYRSVTSGGRVFVHGKVKFRADVLDRDGNRVQYGRDVILRREHGGGTQEEALSAPTFPIEREYQYGTYDISYSTQEKGAGTPTTLHLVNPTPDLTGLGVTLSVRLATETPYSSYWFTRALHEDGGVTLSQAASLVYAGGGSFSLGSGNGQWRIDPTVHAGQSIAVTGGNLRMTNANAVEGMSVSLKYTADRRVGYRWSRVRLRAVGAGSANAALTVRWGESSVQPTPQEWDVSLGADGEWVEPELDLFAGNNDYEFPGTRNTFEVFSRWLQVVVPPDTTVDLAEFVGFRKGEPRMFTQVNGATMGNLAAFTDGMQSFRYIGFALSGIASYATTNPWSGFSGSLLAPSVAFDSPTGISVRGYSADFATEYAGVPFSGGSITVPRSYWGAGVVIDFQVALLEGEGVPETWEFVHRLGARAAATLIGNEEGALTVERASDARDGGQGAGEAGTGFAVGKPGDMDTHGAGSETWDVTTDPAPTRTVFSGAGAEATGPVRFQQSLTMAGAEHNFWYRFVVPFLSRIGHLDALSHPRLGYWCRAYAEGGEIRFRRTDGVAPQAAADLLAPVTVATAPGGHAVAWPAVDLDPDGRLRVRWQQAPDGGGAIGDIYESYSDDDGTTWSTPSMALEDAIQPAFGRGIYGDLGGRLSVGFRPDSPSASAGVLVATFAAPGDDPADLTPFTFQQWTGATYADLRVENSGYALTQLYEGEARWILTVVAEGETDLSDWVSGDEGKSWKRLV